MVQKICNGLISSVTCRKALGNSVHIIIPKKKKALVNVNCKELIQWTENLGRPKMSPVKV